MRLKALCEKRALYPAGPEALQLQKLEKLGTKKDKSPLRNSTQEKPVAAGPADTGDYELGWD